MRRRSTLIDNIVRAIEKTLHETVIREPWPRPIADDVAKASTYIRPVRFRRRTR